MFRLTKTLVPIFSNTVSKRLGQAQENVLTAVQGQRLFSDSGKKIMPKIPCTPASK